MPKIVTDFDKDVPADKVVTEGIDAFSERGRGLMFIEMIADVAGDLVASDSEHYDETLAWVKNPLNLKAWVQIVEASPSVVPSLQKAFLERPAALKLACETVYRASSRTGDGLERFMRAMGMQSHSGSSSLGDSDAMDEMAEVYAL